MKSYLGIDIADTSIEIVELSKARSSFNMVSYARAELARDVIVQGRIKNREGLNNIFQSLLDNASPQPAESRKAVVSFPDSLVYSLNYNIQNDGQDLTGEKLEEVLRDQARATFLIEDENLHIVWLKNVLADGSENYTIFGVDKQIVKNWQLFFKEVGIEVLAIEPEVLGIMRGILADRDSEFQQSSMAVADIGGTKTVLTFFYQGQPIISETILTGGFVWTTQLAQKIGGSFEAAEAQKISFGLESPDMINIVQPLAEKITSSLQKYYSLYQHMPQELFLTGGSAQLPGLTEFLSNYLAQRQTEGQIPEISIPQGDQASMYVEAVGLAMYPTDAKYQKQSVDLRLSESELKEKKIKTKERSGTKISVISSGVDKKTKKQLVMLVVIIVGGLSIAAIIWVIKNASN
ncbi:MAG: pilus assembly protein PilM [bacterium]|nr:pilus assembly protein PilM [bacterium]